MGRLIDADDFKKFLQALCNAGAPYDDIIKLLEKQPTAYDVEKVVAELEIAKEKVAKEDYCRTKHYIENDCEHKDCFKCCAEYLIDIVRKGGAE
jgi:hypothetical protein